MVDEKEEKQEEKPEEEPKPTEDSGKGVQYEADKKIDNINSETERINKAIAENENAKARQKLGGVTEAGQEPPKEKKLSDLEYAEAMQRGEVNPFKEDGLDKK